MEDMQEANVKKNGETSTISDLGVSILVPGDQGENYTINMEYEDTETVEYPSAFLEIVRTWKRLLIREGVMPSGTTFTGRGLGATLVLASCLWCRDHGIPLPARIVLEDPLLVASEGIGRHYFSSADVDDPCAFPLIAEYYGFCHITVEYHESSPLKDHAQQLCRKLEEQGIFFDKKVFF